MRKLSNTLLSSLIIVAVAFSFTGVMASANAPGKNDQKWWKEAICYEVYIKSFKDTTGNGEGDLQGIIDELPYLQKLGVNVIWITPFYPCSGIDNGYAVSDYKDVAKEFGDLDKFKELVKDAKALGIKIMIDMVFNHSSDQNPWFLASSNPDSKDYNQYKDYYLWYDKPINNWPSWFNNPKHPSVWTYSPGRNQYYFHMFSIGQPDLNWANPALRNDINGIVKFWLGMGVSGLRFDVISLISKPDWLLTMPFPPSIAYRFLGDLPTMHQYLHDMYANAIQSYEKDGDILTVGEMPEVTADDAYHTVGNNQWGTQLRTLFQLAAINIYHQPDNPFAAPDKPPVLTDFKNVYDTWYKGLTENGRDGWQAVVLGNHDNERLISLLGVDDPTSKYWKLSAKMLATFIMTQWGTPYIFQGDELGMTNFPFEANPQDMKDGMSINYYDANKATWTPDQAKFFFAHCRDNARTPMQWDSTQNAGFSTGTPWIDVNPNYTQINEAAEENDPDSILKYYIKLIQLRKDYKDALVYGDYMDIDPSNEQVYAYTRTGAQNKLLVVLNFSNKPTSFTTDLNLGVILADNYLDSHIRVSSPIKRLKNGSYHYYLEPYESIVTTIKKSTTACEARDLKSEVRDAKFEI